MPNSDETNPSSDYDYASIFFHFFRTLETLSKDPARQCEVMGYFNVAWELRDDAIWQAKAVLALSEGRLSTEQKEAIDRLLVTLDVLPGSVFNVDNRREDHLRAMSSPPWASVRTEAKALQEILQSEMQRARSILWPKPALE